MTLPLPTPETSKGGLYVIKLSDTHYYGGRALHFRARWRRHLTALEKGTHLNPYLQAVFNKYQRFEPEILETLPDIECMIEAKRNWLSKNYGKPGCVNLSDRPTNNTYVSPEARKKISAANKGRKQSPEAILRSALSRTGLKMSPEARLNMSRAQKGKVIPPETCRKMSISSARKNKPILENLRKAIVESNKKRKGEKRPAEMKTFLSKHVSELIWICSPEETKRVTPSEAHTFLLHGWQRGRKYIRS